MKSAETIKQSDNDNMKSAETLAEANIERSHNDNTKLVETSIERDEDRSVDQTNTKSSNDKRSIYSCLSMEYSTSIQCVIQLRRPTRLPWLHLRRYS